MNLKNIVIVFIFCFLSASAYSQSTMYFSKYKIIAGELSQKYGIPSNVILAVAFVESGAGNSKVALKLNNHFGIVGKNNIGSKYKKFNSVEESYVGFCNIISKKKFYPKLKGNPNSDSWINEIAKTGYSEKPQEWSRQIKLVINKYRLK